MILHDQIAKAYIEGSSLEQFREEWYFSNSDLSREYGKNVFTLPPDDRETREKAGQVYASLRSVLQSFSAPDSSAMALYDGLFPHWREALESVSVDLIAGLPHPHDAVVCSDPSGKLHILLDVVRWIYMLGYDLEGNARGILTHELFHVLLRERWPEADQSSGYLPALDRITFHEGFAHMVQLCAMRAVDWHSEKLTQVRANSRAKLALALAETDPEKRKTYLYEADRGGWYSKYAAMAGMLYLADQWEGGGLPALRAILEAGPAGFAHRCAI
ncbi:MAG: hypothetical protein J6J87_00365 [Oscillospiraceae bacterium]|nr:hypothetical protein [Oscillospiraceae bacterium]